MNFSTAMKIRIAQALSGSVLTARKMLGNKDPVVKCRRGGIEWELDLTEGIDLQIFLFGSFEPDISKALAKILKPGMVAVDIGANVGAHTLPMAAHVGPNGKVIAVEPTDWAFGKLQGHLSRNPQLRERVHAVKAALGEEGQKPPAGFYSSWSLENSGGNQHPIHKGFFKEAKNVSVVSLDSLLAQLKVGSIDVIKLDVDGFEIQVLKGASQTLKKHKPVIFFELCHYVLAEQNSSAEELVHLLQSFGYEFFELNGKLKKLSTNKLKDQLGDRSINLIAKVTS